VERLRGGICVAVYFFVLTNLRVGVFVGAAESLIIYFPERVDAFLNQRGEVLLEAVGMLLR